MTLPRIALASLGALAIVAASSAPAHAAIIGWAGPDSGNQETSVEGNWAGGQLPAAGDVWSFAQGPRANNSLLADTSVGGLVLASPEFLLIGSRIVLGADGVTATHSATLNLDITLTGPQTWTVAEGATLSVAGTALVQTGELTLSPTGTIAVTTGRLDGNGGAGTVRQTSGTVILAGGGGTIGDGGYRVAGGTTHWQGAMGGTAVQVTDATGVLSGTGAAQRITATAGVVSPGPTVGGAGAGELESFDTVTLAPTARLQLDVTDAEADSLLAYQSIDLGGALLDVRVPDGVDPRIRTTIATSTLGTISGTLASADGAITPGEPFVSGGHRWNLESGDGGTSLDLVWIERVIVDEPESGDGEGTTPPGGGDGEQTPPPGGGDGEETPPPGDDTGETTPPPASEGEGASSVPEAETGVQPTPAPARESASQARAALPMMGSAADLALLLALGGALAGAGVVVVSRRPRSEAVRPSR